MPVASRRGLQGRRRSESDFDEVRYGRNYDMLKEAYDRQRRLINMLKDDICKKKQGIEKKD